MAVLSDADRKIAAREFIRFAFEQLAQTAIMDTATIKAAVDAADDWCDTNAAAFNTALPTAFKNTASVAQKNILLAYVALKRANVI